MAELADAAGMAIAAEGGGEESGEAGLRHIDAGKARPHGDHIGVIMLARERGGERLGDQRTATGRVAIDRNRDADARSAQCNTEFSASKSQTRE